MGGSEASSQKKVLDQRVSDGQFGEEEASGITC